MNTNEEQLSKIASKISIKQLNGINCRNDAIDYISQIIESRTEKDWKWIDKQDREAKEYICKRIKTLSEIPMARINQYLELLSSFSELELSDEKIQNIIFYIATIISNELNEIIPGWGNDNWVPEENPCVILSKEEFAEKYHRLIKSVIQSKVGSGTWLQNISELIYICFNI